MNAESVNFKMCFLKPVLGGSCSSCIEVAEKEGEALLYK